MVNMFAIIVSCSLICLAWTDELDSIAFLPPQINMTGLPCGFSCLALDELGPPPDLIFAMPPPPLPPSLQKMLLENTSRDQNAACNFCHIFRDSNREDSEFISPKLAVKSTQTWSSFLLATISGSVVVVVFLFIFLVKCKKWKIFPMTDSCPILPEGFFGSHKTAPPPCSPSDTCISPVVNEKSPQSIITDAPSKKTSIPSKYWRRESKDMRQIAMNGGTMDPNTDIDEHYTACTDGSCTSSPVYAELDAGGVNHSNTPTPLLITGPSQSISPYAVHTYSEVADALRMAALTSSSALLPDASYDNAAYLPSSNSDHYHTRSLRRLRGLQFGQLGSATPLLASHHHLNQLNGSINYLTGSRPQKKPRPPYAHQTTRSNNLRLHEEIESAHLDRQTRLGQGRRQHGLYSDYPINAPNLTTFRVPYGYREPKRPLPPVPSRL